MYFCLQVLYSDFKLNRDLQQVVFKDGRGGIFGLRFRSAAEYQKFEEEFNQKELENASGPDFEEAILASLTSV